MVLIPYEEVARLRGCSVDTIRREVEHGALEAVDVSQRRKAIRGYVALRLPLCEDGAAMRSAPPPEPHTEPAVESRSNEPCRMLTEAQVLDLLPFGRTTLHGLIKNGGFPRGIYVSPNRRVWFADQIAAWQRALEASNPNFNPNRGRGRGRRPRLSVAKGS
jgi:predicted DNA-binding transcriptional regulator AlpA